MNTIKIPGLLTNLKFLLTLYVVITIAASIGEYAKKRAGDPFTRYNNFLIFRESFDHLKDGKDLYVNHEPDHFDLYKYSPGFAVLMAPFTWFPDLPGLILWNLVNALLLFFAFYFLPELSTRAKIFMCWFVLLELLTNLQNSQSNGIMAGLLVWALVHFEKKNVALASLFIMLSAYIKIFGVAAVVLALLYPGKLKFAAYSVLWAVILSFLPLFFISWDQLIMQYNSWFHLTSLDHSTSYGISLLGILHSWFQTDFNKNMVMLSGLVILLIPLIFMHRYKEYDFRLAIFSSLLIWLLIFNHRAESPTYIIAVTGIAIWFFSGHRTTLDRILLVSVLILTSLSPTDLFPRSWRNDWVVPYSLKALPCVLIWIKINYDLLKKGLDGKRSAVTTVLQ